jgi:hypothetical protein
VPQQVVEYLVFHEMLHFLPHRPARPAAGPPSAGISGCRKEIPAVRGRAPLVETQGCFPGKLASPAWR